MTQHEQPEPTVEIVIDPLTEGGMASLCEQLGDATAAEVIYHAAKAELKRFPAYEMRRYCEVIMRTCDEFRTHAGD